MMMDPDKRGSFPRGRIVKVFAGEDGIVRSALVKTSSGEFKRPALKLSYLELEEEQAAGGVDDVADGSAGTSEGAGVGGAG